VLWVIPGDDGEGRLYEDQGDSEAYKSGEYATTRFTQTHSIDGMTLTIHPREGTFADMAEERAWKVVFFSVGEPSSVCIDGNETSSWSYDEQTCRLTVDVPSRSCSEAIVIRMKEVETGLQSIAGNGLEMRYDSRSERLLVDSEQSDFVVTVHDLQGKQWIRLQHSSTEGFGISLSSLPKGEYICNCRAGSATVSRKILKP
jgi:hypothetical protein